MKIKNIVQNVEKVIILTKIKLAKAAKSLIIYYVKQKELSAKNVM